MDENFNDYYHTTKGAKSLFIVMIFPQYRRMNSRMITLTKSVAFLKKDASLYSWQGEENIV